MTLGIFKLILLMLFIALAEATEKYLGWPAPDVYRIIILAMVIDLWIAVRLEDNLPMPWKEKQ